MRKKKIKTENKNLDPKLRDEAEEKLAQFFLAPRDIQGKNPEELLQELQIHQIELEMQNEELRKTQLALEESRQRYADLYDFAPVGYFTFTPEALIKEVNLTGSTLLGVTRQKLINTRFRKIITAKDQDLWDQHFLSVLREGEKQTCDLILKRPEGSPFYAGLESIRREVGRGAFLVHTTVTNITERKRLEEVIRESEERYRTAVIEEIGEGYYEVDLAGNFTFVNDSMIRLLQYSREELIGMTFRDFIPREEVEGVYETFNRVYRTGEIVKCYPITNIRKDGTPVFLEGSISCRRDREGRVIGFRGISHDITERKRTEEEIRLKQFCINHALDSIAWITKEAHFFDVNEGMCRSLGYSREELTSMRIFDIDPDFPEEDWPGLWEKMKKVGSAIFETYHRRKDGSIFPVEVIGSIMVDNGKEYHLGIARDITERKKAEEESLKYQKQLQSLTVKLSEVEETERKEIARTLHDLVGQNLTALNLNLTIILGMLSEDQNPLLVSRLEESQKLLEDTTQHIREVMSELRPSVLDDFGLTAALRWYGQRFKRMTGIQTNVEGEEFSPRLPTLLETVIFRITQEALINVLKHASAGKVDLQIEKVEDRVRLTIADDGRGFNFKGFRFGGEKRGWGLSMMRERAVALGGGLQIFSEPGKGTRVILHLPVER